MSAEGSDALAQIAASLRQEESVISPHVRDPDHESSLGRLAAAGPRAAADPGQYAVLVESIREGYLLHYGTPRVLNDPGRDLALLAGDYLYALGLERLAALGDLEAVRELSDLISLSAQLHADGDPQELVAWLWLASLVAVAAGPLDGYESAKQRLRSASRQGDLDPGEAGRLRELALARASEAGLDDALAEAAESIDLPGSRDG